MREVMLDIVRSGIVDTELELAYNLHEHAIRDAHKLAPSGDLQAMTQAALKHAFILSTPDLTPMARARLFLETEE